MKTKDLDPYHVMRLEEVAEELGIGRARVWQIEQRALQKLRTECARRGFTLDDLLWEASQTP